MKQALQIFVIAIISLSFSVNVKANPKPKQAPIQVSKLLKSSLISGKITDKINGEELTGVAIKLKGTDQVSYTDFDGNYFFKNVPEGKYAISIQYISYKTISNTIVVKNNEAHEINVKLEQKK